MPGVSRDMLSTVPTPPLHFLPRPEHTDALVAHLCGAGAGATVGIAGVHGMGGLGKTVLAAAVARDERVRARFADGVYWLTLGERPELASLQARLARALGLADTVFDSVAAGKERLAAALADKSVLLVLDDVWDADSASYLDVVGNRGRVLMTTRDRSLLTPLGATEHALELLVMDDALALLAHWVGVEPAVLPAEAGTVARACGCLPLALAMIGGMVHQGTPWADVADFLAHADLDEIALEVPGYPHVSVLAAMDVSVRALPPELRPRYLDLAIFAEDQAIPEDALAVLWGVRPAVARRQVQKLELRSLVQRDGSGARRLHDVQRMYVRKRAAADRGLAARHAAFIDALAARCQPGADGLGRGPTGADVTDDERAYFFAKLPYHLMEAGRPADLRDLLMTYSWLDAKLRAAGPAELIADFEHLERAQELDRAASDRAVGLVRDALRLASHVLERDADQLPSQLVGRLGYFEAAATPDLAEPDILALLEAVRGQVEHPWLCPITPALTQAGGPLVRTFEGHSDGVLSVALSADGSRALSGSHDRTIRFWDTQTGALLRTFHGHSEAVTAVALSADGTRALSGSQDRTVRFWDTQTGALLDTFQEHSKEVTAVALSADGMRALSGSHDKTVRFWDTQTGVLRHTFRQGHSKAVTAVALSSDGTRALSGSYDNTLRLWDTNTGALLHTFEGHSRGVTAVALSGDGTRALSGSHDKTVRFWDTQTGALLCTFQGHSKEVWAVALSGDGTRALSASWDRTVWLWDTHTGRTILTFTADELIFGCALAWTREPMVVAGDSSGRVHFLRFLPGQPAAARRASAASTAKPKEPEPMNPEARLIELLSATLDTDTLRSLLRLHVSKAFADALPATSVPRATYMDQAAEKLIGQRALTPAFIDAWADRVPGRADEIRALAAHIAGPAPAAPASAHAVTHHNTINIIGSPGAQLAMGEARVHARDITVTVAQPADQPVSAEAWQRDVEAILGAIIDRMAELDSEVWAKSTAIFKRLHALEVAGQTGDELAATVQASLAAEDRTILQKLLPSIRPILEQLAASALWQGLLAALTRMG